MVESSGLFSPQKKKIKPSKLAGATIYKGTQIWMKKRIS